MATSDEQGGKLEKKKDGEAEGEKERRRRKRNEKRKGKPSEERSIGDGGEDGISLRIELYT